MSTCRRAFALALALPIVSLGCAGQRPTDDAIVVGISPIADFTFLKDVRRRTAGSS